MGTRILDIIARGLTLTGLPDMLCKKKLTAAKFFQTCGNDPFFTPRHFNIYPRRLFCGQLACQFLEGSPKWPACWPIFSKSFQEILRNLSLKIIMWIACQFLEGSQTWPVCLPIFSKSFQEIFRNLSPKIIMWPAC